MLSSCCEVREGRFLYRCIGVGNLEGKSEVYERLGCGL